MRLPLILGLGLALAVSPSFAQQQKTTRTKKPAHVPARSEKTRSANAAPLPKTTATSAETAKDLRRIEQQTAKTPLKANSAGQKHASGSAALLKTKPAPASGSSGGLGTAKGTGTSQSKNPYRGRLRQKGSH